jgi:hypothetical protein
MQEVQIQNLNNNPGILPFKLGHAKIKIASHTFLHYINLKPIKNKVDYLNHKISEFKKVVESAQSKSYHELINQYEHIKHQMKVINKKLNIFYPLNRQKRGIINPLGSLVKFISGNMDNDDAQEIHEHILKLETTENKIIRQLNNHISLSKNIMLGINDTFASIIQNQIKLDNKTNELIQSVNEDKFNYLHFTITENILHQINYNLDSLLIYLSELENAVTFANLEIVHPSILSYEDLKIIINELYSIYDHKQLLFSNINDLSKYYSIIKIKVRILNEKIMFSLEFPLIHPETFDHYHLFSIPNINQLTIIPGQPLILEKIILKNSTVSQIEKLHLNKIPLDKLHQVQLKEVEELPIEEINLHKRFSISSLAIILTMTILCLIYFIIKFKNKCSQKILSSSNPRIVNETQVVPP